MCSRQKVELKAGGQHGLSDQVFELNQLRPDTDLNSVFVDPEQLMEVGCTQNCQTDLKATNCKLVLTITMRPFLAKSPV